MPRRYVPHLLLLTLTSLAGCLPAPYTKITTIQPLGRDQVRAVVYSVQGSDLILFNMHDDENTAVQAGLSMIRRRGGKLYTLEHSGDRRIHFRMEGRSFDFDPNRMFTDLGTRRTLNQQADATAEAFSEVRSFAEAVLRVYDLREARVLITLHNNTEGAYSARSYLPEGPYAGEAEAVHVAEGQDPDDFYFVTERSFFDDFVEAGYNAVLQDNRSATDDGSLSVLAASRNVPYINIEAQHGHRKKQEAMLRLVYELLGKAP